MDEEKTSLELSKKTESTYRVKRIDIQTRENINQIKITYDDDSVWCYGQDGGTKDKRAIVLTKGEYLVRVCHERLYTYRSAGSYIEFETNKGRVFKFKPGTGWRGLATEWEGEQTVIRAEKGMEIISLIIRRGVLVGSEQQPVPSDDLAFETPNAWYVYCYSAAKEDINCSQNGFAQITAAQDNEKEGKDFIYEHFQSKLKALHAWKSKLPSVHSKKGRGAILIDCLSSQIVRKSGDNVTIENCIDDATKEGFYVSPPDEQVSIFKVLLNLYKTTISRKDILLFIIGIFVTMVSGYLSVHGELIKGDLLTLLISTNKSELQRNRYVRVVCGTVLDCDLTNHINLCKALILAGFLLKIMQITFGMVNIYITETINRAKDLNMRQDILVHVLKLDQSFFDTHSSSHLSGSMNIGAIIRMLNWNIPDMLTSYFKLIMTMYYLLAIDLYLGGFSIFLTISLSFGITHKVKARLQTAKKYEWKWDSALYEIRGKILCHLKLIKMFSSEEKHLSEFDSVRKQCVGSFKFNTFYRCLLQLVYGVTDNFIFGGSVFLCLHYIQRSGLTSSKITGFFFLLQQLKSLTERLIHQDEWMRGNFRDLDRYIRLKEEKPSMKNGEVKIEDLKGEIVFKDVYFSYPSRPTEEVLKGFNMVIKAHKMTAIVGDSGAGKSTIANLLMRLYDPSSGSIEIDDHDLKSFNIKDLHSKMSIVNQNPGLFGATIGENIGYGCTSNQWNNEEMKKAGELANCGFVDKFRAGYDTFAGSSGTQLSGGQKQRIAIARAAIRNPKILILDEATSSLDAENEKEVQEALENVMKGRTIVVIAHRLSTIRNADNIICMKDGQLAEQGTHEELMELKGVYHNLISKQVVQEKKL